MGVRLLSELFERCLQMLQSNSISSSCISQGNCLSAVEKSRVTFRVTSITASKWNFLVV